ncbi:MAG: hypothetical protein WKH64_01325 [Chloroflexia bacterium]
MGRRTAGSTWSAAGDAGSAIYGRPTTATAVDYLLQPYVVGVNSCGVEPTGEHALRAQGGGSTTCTLWTGATH